VEVDYVSTSGRSTAALNVWGEVFANTKKGDPTVLIAEGPTYASISDIEEHVLSVQDFPFVSMVGEKQPAKNAPSAMYTCARDPWPNRLGEPVLFSGRQ